MNRIIGTQLKYVHNYSLLINNPKPTNKLFVRNKTIKTFKTINNNELPNIDSKKMPYKHLFVTSKSKTPFMTDNQLITYSKINNQLMTHSEMNNELNELNKPSKLNIYVKCILYVLGSVIIGIGISLYSIMIYHTIDAFDELLKRL